MGYLLPNGINWNTKTELTTAPMDMYFLQQTTGCKLKRTEIHYLNTLPLGPL